MNRSIAKTRNQLQRITLKINQLKTKYTADNQTHLLSESSPTRQGQISLHPQTLPSKKYSIPKTPISTTNPLHQSSEQRHSDAREGREGRVGVGMSGVFVEQQFGVSGNNTAMPIGISHRYQKYGDDGPYYQKDFKIFRNEIYNYIQKCLMLTKDREEEMLARIKEDFVDMYGAKSKKSNSGIEQRIKKIQQQTTNCLSNLQDIIVLFKKNQKNYLQKFSHLQQKLRNQSQQCPLSPTLTSLSSSISTLSSQHQSLSESLHFLQQKHGSYSENMQIKLQNLQTRIKQSLAQEKLNSEQFCLLKVAALQDMIDKYVKFNVMLEKNIVGLSQECEKRGKQMADKLEAIRRDKDKQSKAVREEENEEVNIKIGSLQAKLRQFQSKITQLQYQFSENNNKKSISSQQIHQLSTKLSEQIATKTTKISQQLSAKLSCQLSSKLSEELSTKLTQEISTKISEQVSTKYCEQVSTRLSEQVSTKLSHQLSATVSQQIQKKLSSTSNTLSNTLFNTLTSSLSTSLSNTISSSLSSSLSTSLSSSLSCSLRQQLSASLLQQQASITSNLQHKLLLISEELANTYTSPFEELKYNIERIQETVEKNCHDIASLAQELLQNGDGQAEKGMGQIMQVLQKYMQRNQLVINSLTQSLPTIPALLQSLTSSHKKLQTHTQTDSETLQNMCQTIENTNMNIHALFTTVPSSSSANKNHVNLSPIPKKQSPEKCYRGDVLEQLQKNVRVGVVAQLTKGVIGDVGELRNRVGRLQGKLEDVGLGVQRDIQKSVCRNVDEFMAAKLATMQRQLYSALTQQLKTTLSTTNTPPLTIPPTIPIPQLSHIQKSLKSQLQHQLQQHLQQKLCQLSQKIEQNTRNLTRIQTVDSLQQGSSYTTQRNKTSPKEEEIIQQCDGGSNYVGNSASVNGVGGDQGWRRGLEIVEDKLNQFQADINQTIKLLYEDIENKVNDMIRLTGVTDFRAEFQTTRNQLTLLQSQYTNLSILTTKLSTPPPPSQHLQTLKQQLQTQLATQQSQLCLQMQQNFEQAQLKIQKLQSHFNYLYERMSNVQYDNANFKDKLTYLLEKGSPSKIGTGQQVYEVEYRQQVREYHEVNKQYQESKEVVEFRELGVAKEDSERKSSGKKSQGNLLQMLGQFGSGHHFFDN